jgi:hypothetical protein
MHKYVKGCEKGKKNRIGVLEKKRERTKVWKENDAIESFIWHEKCKSDMSTQLCTKS